MVVLPVPDGAEITNNFPESGRAAADENCIGEKIVSYKLYQFIIVCAVKINLLRCLVSMQDNDLNVFRRLRGSCEFLQPSVSKNLMVLENDLGPLFVRRGRRFAGITPLGREVLATAREILVKYDNIAALKRRYGEGASGGDIRIGTTHLQARYVFARCGAPIFASLSARQHSNSTKLSRRTDCDAGT